MSSFLGLRPATKKVVAQRSQSCYCFSPTLIREVRSVDEQRDASPLDRLRSSSTVDAPALDSLIAWLSRAKESSDVKLLRELALLARDALEKRFWYACSERMPPKGQPVLIYSEECNYLVESHDGTGWGNPYLTANAEPTYWCHVPTSRHCAQGSVGFGWLPSQEWLDGQKS